MTKAGFEAILTEIDHLWRVERPVVVKEVTSAAEMGDRSENAAYIYGKKRLREIDSRLRYLRKKTEGVVVVDTSTQVNHPTIQFGAIVTVEDPSGVVRTFRLVDRDESDPKRSRISVQSPMGKALMGKEEGDGVTVVLPKGQSEYHISRIRYGRWDP